MESTAESARLRAVAKGRQERNDADMADGLRGVERRCCLSGVGAEYRSRSSDGEARRTKVAPVASENGRAKEWDSG